MNRRTFFRGITGGLALALVPKTLWDALTTRPQKVRTIAHWMPENIQQLEDFPKIRRMIDERLRAVMSPDDWDRVMDGSTPHYLRRIFPDGTRWL